MPRDGVEMHSIMKFWSETLKAPAPPCSDDTDAVSFEVMCANVVEATMVCFKGKSNIFISVCLLCLCS